MASAVIGALRVTLGLDSAAFDDGLKTARDKMAKAGQSLKSAGQSMSAYMTVPLVGFGALTVKTAGDFEASMNRVQAATGASADEFKAMRDMAIELGAETSFSASESADAMEMLAKNGVAAGQILDGAVAASMKLAAASGSELSASADVATDVMMSFGKEAKDLSGVVDGITGVLLQSKFGFEDYRLAIGQAGGVAGSIGVEFEDFNAVIAATSASFSSGSDAGTSFKNFLTRLIPQTDGAAEAMERLGLEFFEADGTMKSMSAIAEQLQTSMAGLSQEQLNADMKTIFGVDAMRTAIGLMNQGSEGIDRFRSKIAEASAEEQAAARLKGFRGEMEKLMGAIETLQISLADSGLLSAVTDIVSKLAGWIDKLGELNPAILKWGTVIAAVAAAAGPAAIGIGAMATAVAVVSAPILAAVAAVGALATAWFFWDDIKASFPVTASVIESALTMVGQNFKLLMENVGLFVQYFKQVFTGDFRAAGETVKQIVSNVAQMIVNVFKALPGQMLQIGKDIMQGLWNGLKSMGSSVVEGAKGIASNVVSGIRGIFDTHSPSRVMQDIGHDVMAGLGIGMKDMEGDVTNVASGISQTVSSAFQGLIDGSKTVKDVISDLIGKLSEMFINQGFQALLGGGIGGGGGGGLFGSVFGGLGKLLGFANGGSFQVGGAGGIDSQLVAFKASPNERVTVTKPGQEGGGRDMHITVGVAADGNGNIKPFVQDVARGEAAAVSRAGIQAFDSHLSNTWAQRSATAQQRQG